MNMKSVGSRVATEIVTDKIGHFTLTIVNVSANTGKSTTIPNRRQARDAV
jgi:hypothetical protein